MNTYQTLKDYYLNKGLKIFPIVKNGKTPMIEAWQNDCSCDRLQITYWLDNAKDCNWGLPCNENNLFVIDIDVHNVNGLENAKRLFRDLGITQIDTLSQITPSGGVHLIFKSDEELMNVANTSNSFKDYPGIDIRTTGYIVCYASYIDGKQYTYRRQEEIKEMPKELKDFILSQKDLVKNETCEYKEYVKPKEVKEGNRDTEIFLYITNLYYQTRLDEEEILVLAKHFNENICEEPLPERTIRYKVRKAFKKDRGKCLFIKLGDVYNERDEE